VCMAWVLFKHRNNTTLTFTCYVLWCYNRNVLLIIKYVYICCCGLGNFPNKVILWYRVFIKQLSSQMVKKSPLLMKPKGSSQKPAIGLLYWVISHLHKLILSHTF
jgi:hypothetical protein